MPPTGGARAAVKERGGGGKGWAGGKKNVGPRREKGKRKERGGVGLARRKEYKVMVLLFLK